MPTSLNKWTGRPNWEWSDRKNKEMKLPERPIFFTKATTSVNGPFADIPFDAHVSEQMDWEAELGVVRSEIQRDEIAGAPRLLHQGHDERQRPVRRYSV